MTRDELEELFNSCKSWFRLEAKQSYDWVGEDEAREQWERDGTIPADEEEDSVVRAAVERGTWIARVHVVDLPLTPYLRFEIAAYQVGNIPSGEQVLMAVRAWHPDLVELVDDFALVDDKLVIWFDYDEASRTVGYRASTDKETLDRCRRQRDAALEHGISVEEFLKLPEVV